MSNAKDPMESLERASQDAGSESNEDPVIVEPFQLRWEVMDPVVRDYIGSNTEPPTFLHMCAIRYMRVASRLKVGADECLSLDVREALLIAVDTQMSVLNDARAIQVTYVRLACPFPTFPVTRTTLMRVVQSFPERGLSLAKISSKTLSEIVFACARPDTLRDAKVFLRPGGDLASLVMQRNLGTLYVRHAHRAAKISDLSGLRFCRHLTRLTLKAVGVSNDVLEKLSCARDLQILRLSDAVLLSDDDGEDEMDDRLAAHRFRFDNLASLAIDKIYGGHESLSGYHVIFSLIRSVSGHLRRLKLCDMSFGATQSLNFVEAFHTCSKLRIVKMLRTNVVSSGGLLDAIRALPENHFGCVETWIPYKLVSEAERYGAKNLWSSAGKHYAKTMDPLAITHCKMRDFHPEYRSLAKLHMSFPLSWRYSDVWKVSESASPHARQPIRELSPFDVPADWNDVLDAAVRISKGLGRIPVVTYHHLERATEIRILCVKISYDISSEHEENSKNQVIMTAVSAFVASFRNLREIRLTYVGECDFDLFEPEPDGGTFPITHPAIQSDTLESMTLMHYGRVSIFIIMDALVYCPKLTRIECINCAEYDRYIALIPWKIMQVLVGQLRDRSPPCNISGLGLTWTECLRADVSSPRFERYSQHFTQQ